MPVILLVVTVVLPIILMVFSYMVPVPALFAPVFYGTVVLVIALRIIYGALADKHPKNPFYEMMWASTKTNMMLFLIPGVLLAFILPQLAMVRQIDSDTRLMKELAGAREAITKYYQTNGKYPERIVMPRLTVWAEAEDGGSHFHRGVEQVIIKPGIAGDVVLVEVSSAAASSVFSGVRALPSNIGDEGKWIYDPETGRLFFACTGFETRSRCRIHEL